MLTISSVRLKGAPLTKDLTSPLGVDGEFGLVFGTSASSPVMASMVTLINDARLAAGKGPVGK